MILESSLLGGVFGGLLRLAPEILKIWDRKSERQHEQKMLQLEHDFAKSQAEVNLKIAGQQTIIKELDTIGEAFREQAVSSAQSGKIIAAINALVRPTITYLFILAYFLVKLAQYSLAIDTGGLWQEQVILSLWTKEDVTILFMIISFWFVGRVYERNQR